ncbi:glycosyltransferase family 4 protein [Methylorubrum aminovorans]|uniref:glycosyltransferase family 4 protein n=1 Tax=Methylorubrum aminovorans TaxID=269069 RepID=UPI003C2E04FB
MLNADLINIEPRRRRIFCDVTVISVNDKKSGIERVIREIIGRIVIDCGVEYQVFLVSIREGEVVFVENNFFEFFVERNKPGERINACEGDIYLVLDWAPDRFCEAGDWLQEFRRSGGKVCVVVYDLIPLEFPAYFPDWLRHIVSDWIDAILVHADYVACISRTVADTFAQLAERRMVPRADPITLSWFHLGSNASATEPTTDEPSDAAAILTMLEQRPYFIVVGTVEPRKGHQQLLAGFDLLWKRDIDVGLLIVGRQGWMVEAVSNAIRDNPEFGKRLLWLTGAGDTFVSALFNKAAALIAPSRAEGFGLPLIEAAEHGLPVIARDIPVFREVAGAHALYFQGETASTIADAVVACLEARADGTMPSSTGMPRIDWAGSARQLIDIFTGRRRYLTSTAGYPVRTHPEASREGGIDDAPIDCRQAS